MKKVLYICLALIITSCGNNNKENKEVVKEVKEVKEVNEEEINIKNIFGVWEGIQEPYYLVDKFGDYVEIAGNRVLVPETEYSFLLEEDNNLSIKQRSDDNSYIYSGKYRLVNSNDNNLNLSCKATYDNNSASLDLDIKYDKKNDFIRVSTKDKTIPNFNLKRKGTITSSENKPSEIVEDDEQSKEINLAIITDPNGTTNVRLGKGTITSSENKPSEIVEDDEQSKEINLAIITDPNGTTNVRLGKGTNSPVIYKLETNEVFDVYPNSDKWWLVELRNKQRGYIFYDRVSLIRNGLDGKYTDLSNYFLKEDDLASYSNYDLKIMRNEIFARNGYIFKEGGEMNNYFMKEDWYKPKLKNVDANLTKVEKYNIELIRKVENRRQRYGQRPPPPPAPEKIEVVEDEIEIRETTSVNGKYYYSGSGLEITVVVNGSSFITKNKMCNYCDIEYTNGIVKGNDLYESSGYIKIGEISGSSLKLELATGTAFLTKK